MHLGSINFRRLALIVDGDAIFIHPRYDERNFANNVGLLRLRRPLNFTNEVNPTIFPIRLPALSQHNITFEQDEVYFQGFGYTAHGKSFCYLFEETSEFNRNIFMVIVLQVTEI